MLQSLLIIPIIGSAIIYFIQDTTFKNYKQIIRLVALSTAVINFIISIGLWINFDASTNDYQFVYEFNQMNFCHLIFGVDGISLFYVLLTTFITPIAIFADFKNITHNTKYFYI